MQLFDLHCDTLYRAVNENKTFNCGEFHITVEKAKFLKKWTQCFAIWIPDDINPNSIQPLFDKAYNSLNNQCKTNDLNLCSKFSDLNENYVTNARNGFFTVENGKVLQGDLKNIKKLKQCNVKILTLTWNSDNEIGTGALTKSKKGLTEFGRQAVKELEKSKIVVDISHASENTFYDVAEISERPFIATHSNSKAVTNHLRNLTDEQFRIIVKNGGIVGINFYKGFLNNNADKASISDIIKHTEHFLSLGGENSVAIGSDFDGCDLPNDIKGIESIGDIYEAFLKENYSEALLSKLFFKNAYNFCENFDN